MAFSINTNNEPRMSNNTHFSIFHTESNESDESLLLPDDDNSGDHLQSYPSQKGHHVHFPPNTHYGEEVVDHPLLLYNENKGRTDILSQKYESLDYDTCENALYIKNENRLHKDLELCGVNCKNISHETRVQLNRWILVFIIGCLTALVGVSITLSIDFLSKWKFRFLKKVFYDSLQGNYIIVMLLYWYLLNSIPVALGSILVTYWAPISAGSGIPVIKCYLNGVKVPEVVRFKTLVSKAVGVVGSVVGGLAVGKEGPMIHCGAVIAAGVSQGKSSTFRKDLKMFEEFREDQEKRDFVSAGTAAGVAAAFGAPIGGVLFSLEEGASFWNQSLTWRILFCSLISTFTLKSVLSYTSGHPGELNFYGLFNFGKMQDISYEYFEVPMFIIMGALGGLWGALYNALNHHLSTFRMRYIQRKWMRVLEAVGVSIITATIGFLLVIYQGDCLPMPYNVTVGKFYLQCNCPSGEYNSLAQLLFQTPEECVKSLLNEDAGIWTISSLALFFGLFQGLTCLTYGLSISSGLFIPSLMVGAAFGRIISASLLYFLPGHEDWINPAKFALIGAAANLGGVVRMTISLTVILLEATGNLSLGLPLMITLLVAKWVGDRFNEGLYDIHIEMAQVPLLGWEPPPRSHKITAADVMSCPVTVLNMEENVGTIVEILEKTTHNGFPVVINETGEDEHVQSYFVGLILRWQLVALLHRKIFVETASARNELVALADFRNDYPRFLQIWHVHLAAHEKEYTLDLSNIMNPSPYYVNDRTSLGRMFRLFRSLGLRHLVVVNYKNNVVGMVTRKDLARFRYDGKDFFELTISAN